MSSIDPIGYHVIRPAERVGAVSRQGRRDPEDQEESKEPEDEPDEGEQAPPDDRPAPQHVDLRG